MNINRGGNWVKNIKVEKKLLGGVNKLIRGIFFFYKKYWKFMLIKVLYRLNREMYLEFIFFKI